LLVLARTVLGLLEDSIADAIQPLGWASLIVLLAASFLINSGNKILYVGGSFVIAVCAAMLIHSLVISGRNRLSSIFNHPVLLWLGKRSYGLYVWHWPFFYLCGALRRPALAIPLGLISAIVAAALSYRFIELPFLRMKESIKKKHKDHAEASADLCAFLSLEKG
jgi:peptidoglycan/LPS O-acetylase OafA/YrhL